MEPRAKQGIDILFPASVRYSLNLMTDEYTESTETKNSNINIVGYRCALSELESSECGIFRSGNTEMASLYSVLSVI